MGTRLVILFGFALLRAVALFQPAVGQVPPIAGACMYKNYPADCMGDVSGCAGCGLDIPVTHASTCDATGGGWDFTGTKYDGAGHMFNGLFPKLRFWEFDNFMGANSGCQDMAPPASPWVQSGLDLRCTGYDDKWYAVAASWRGPGIDGCPVDTAHPRTVVERSEDGWYAVASVEGTGASVDLSTLRAGHGAEYNEIPVFSVPAPLWSTRIGAVGNYDIVDVRMPAEPPYYVDSGGPDLIDGAGLMYVSGGPLPTDRTPTAYTGWASDPAAPDDTRPYVILWGQTTPVAIPTPANANIHTSLPWCTTWTGASAGLATSWAHGPCRGRLPLSRFTACTTKCMTWRSSMTVARPAGRAMGTAVRTRGSTCGYRSTSRYLRAAYGL